MAAGSAMALLLALGLVAGAMGQAAELLNSLPPPGQLSTVFYFPEHPLKNLAAGEVITAVISAHNDGAKAYNLTAVVASLNSPYNFEMYIQNFTHQVYFDIVEPGQERSLEYKFRLAPQVPQRDFLLALHLIYEDVGGEGSQHGYYSNIVFNGTVDVVEAPHWIDFQAIFMYLMIAGLCLGTFYWVASNYQWIGSAKAAKKSKAKKGAAQGASFDEDEWVKGTPYDVERRKKAAAAAKTKAA